LLDGSGDNQSCSPDTSTDCIFDGQLVPYGKSIDVYLSPHPTSGTCKPDTLTCVKGNTPGKDWNGPTNDRFASCTIAPTKCSASDPTDLKDPNDVAYTRRCQSGVIVSEVPLMPAYDTDLTMFGEVFGFAPGGDPSGWPGAFDGLSPEVEVMATEYISLAFSPSPARSIHIIENPSFSVPAQISVSRRPGVFSASDPDMVCSSPDIISSSGWNGGTNCLLGDDPSETYYLNLAPSPGADCSANFGQCEISFTLYFVYQ
jgi:hypothetical protein